MKSISTALKAHYASGTTTVALLVKLTRTDGVVLAVALDHDQDITYDGVTYKSVFGLVSSAIETSAQMNVDSLDAKGALLALGVNEADINAGLWDNAVFALIRVNWADLTMGHEKIKDGWFGEISIGRSEFNAEFRGLTQKLQSTIGDVVSPSCKNDLFDSKCTIPRTEGTWKFSGKAVTGVTNNRTFVISTLAQASGYFSAGKVTWTTGLNTGLSKEIKTHTATGNFVLQEPMPYNIAVSDQCTVEAGCLKRFDEDCGTKFSNGPNFNGFPFLPGQDQTLKGV